jgi:hypothetical protein
MEALTLEIAEAEVEDVRTIGRKVLGVDVLRFWHASAAVVGRRSRSARSWRRAWVRS